MISTVEDLVSLLQLASPALPLGAFSYSQGLEAAIEAGIIRDETTTRSWITSGLHEVLGRCELPVMFAQFASWQTNAVDDLRRVDHWFRVTRETKELREETEQMGWSLVRLALSLEINDPPRRKTLAEMRPIGFPSAYAFVAQGLQLNSEAAATAFAFSWVENQVSVAVKTVPLGQSAGQKILMALRPVVRRAIEQPRQLESVSTFTPHLAILSARHETQYSRLFRS
ncbi:MAG: urease accessory protein UreF [Verrucomicrobia bacterium]|nr:urease accessory protein UreF [Verrucomicrobiota bacterium]